MQLNISDSWKNILQTEFEKPYFKNLEKFVKSEYQNYTCYPDEKDIFTAFNACDFDNLKVVIIGQDPYHGKGQANGLCFSVKDGIKHPPSLKNIFKNITSEFDSQSPKSGDLSRWATQGVLLLNATLTVREQEAGSHQKQGWEIFTDAVISEISTQKKDIIFLLWGKFAVKKGAKINRIKHEVLTSAHPSPLGAWRGWFENQHFSKTNKFLASKNKSIINW
jgi:uracil-DNA glycosylase